MKRIIRPLKSIFYLCVMLVLLNSCAAKKVVTDSKRVREHAENAPANLSAKYATALNVPLKNIDNLKLYRFIDEWMGTPHYLGGMTKDGVDCSGFTSLLELEVYKQNLPRTAKQMATEVKIIKEEQLKEGDLVFFDFNGQQFSHVGIYLQNNKFVHVSTTRGVIISDLKDAWYYKYFSRAGSLH